MVVLSGDVHLRVERYVTRWFLGNDQLNSGNMPERYFRCNDQLMSCPFPVPICERLAFNVFPCRTSLFLEPCEWQESYHISSHGCSIIAKGQASTPGSARRFRITLKSGKRRLAVLGAAHSTSKPVSLAVGLVEFSPCCGNLLPVQFSHYAPKLREPYPYQCCAYSFFIHPVVQYGCKQICQPFPVTPEVGSLTYGHYGRFLAFKAWFGTWSDFFLDLVFLVEDCHMFV